MHGFSHMDWACSISWRKLKHVQLCERMPAKSEHNPLSRISSVSENINIEKKFSRNEFWLANDSTKHQIYLTLHPRHCTRHWCIYKPSWEKAPPATRVHSRCLMWWFASVARHYTLCGTKFEQTVYIYTGGYRPCRTHQSNAIVSAQDLRDTMHRNDDTLNFWSESHFRLKGRRAEWNRRIEVDKF